MAQYSTIKGITVSVGDTVKVYQKIKEGEKTRLQVFEGAVIAIANRQNGKTFTVRKVATDGIGVERIYPAETPMIDHVEIKQKGEVRRAKLFYLRSRIGRAATSIRKKIAAVSTK
jgi:large subunit ribosomal protein L19